MLPAYSLYCSTSTEAEISLLALPISSSCVCGSKISVLLTLGTNMQIQFHKSSFAVSYVFCGLRSCFLQSVLGCFLHFLYVIPCIPSLNIHFPCLHFSTSIFPPGSGSYPCPPVQHLCLRV